MNPWTQLSVDFANQRNYLDELFRVYPTIPEGLRDIDQQKWNAVEKAFNSRNNRTLIQELLKLKLFPIKDSYVAYLRKDPSAIERNPQTIARLAGRLYELGLNEIFERCSEPKETNRKIGPLFKRWVESGVLGAEISTTDEFLHTQSNAILKGSDNELLEFAGQHLGYKGDKGLDLIARFNGKYVVGEAKFLTDFGGHQNAQFGDAKNLLKAKVSNAIKIAILDGVLYIPKKTKCIGFCKIIPRII